MHDGIVRNGLQLNLLPVFRYERTLACHDFSVMSSTAWWDGFKGLQLYLLLVFRYDRRPCCTFAVGWRACSNVKD
jgi:hypothetical protein